MPEQKRKARRKKRMLTGVSRQRRAANARERVRIQGVNEALMDLKRFLPLLHPDAVSRTDTLRLASKWIAHLTAVLLQDDRRRRWSPGTNEKCLPESLHQRLDELKNVEVEEYVFVGDEALRSKGINLGDTRAQELHSFSNSPNKGNMCQKNESNWKSSKSKAASSASNLPTNGYLEVPLKSPTRYQTSDFSQPVAMATYSDKFTNISRKVPTNNDVNNTSLKDYMLMYECNNQNNTRSQIASPTKNNDCILGHYCEQPNIHVSQRNIPRTEYASHAPLSSLNFPFCSDANEIGLPNLIERYPSEIRCSSTSSSSTFSPSSSPSSLDNDDLLYDCSPTRVDMDLGFDFLNIENAMNFIPPINLM